MPPNNWCGLEVGGHPRLSWEGWTDFEKLYSASYYYNFVIIIVPFFSALAIFFALEHILGDVQPAAVW